MSIPFSPTPTALRVELKSSNYFYVALGGVAIVALAAIFHAQLSWPLRASLAMLICGYGVYCGRMQRRQHGILQWRSAWFWSSLEGKEQVLKLRHCTVWPGLIAMRFYDVERKRHFALMLFADSFVAADSARNLRVHLRHFPVFDSEVNGPDERAS